MRIRYSGQILICNTGCVTTLKLSMYGPETSGSLCPQGQGVTTVSNEMQ